MFARAINYMPCAGSVRYFSLNPVKRRLEKPVFDPKKAVILTKVTRYEYEKRSNACKTENELKTYLHKKGSDYDGLYQRHQGHTEKLDTLKDTLRSSGIETKVLQRFDYTPEAIDWADVIFSAGGDGTFLLAASKIKNRETPVIGINTDPMRSEGYLCLPSARSNNIPETVKQLLKGNLNWYWRKRIRITLSGGDVNLTPIELHNQQLKTLEHRFSEHVQEHEAHTLPKHVPPGRPSYVLPALALNEVFVGETLSARVSYYEISLDDNNHAKQKSSGVTACTGTGSSSWFFNINHIAKEDVKHLLQIANQKSSCEFPVDNDSLVRGVTHTFNSSLRFDPEELNMAYTIRDPVFNGIFQVSQPRGFAKKMSLRSRMYDACLVIDGGLSFEFNDGAVAVFEMFPEDALRTVQLT